MMETILDVEPLSRVHPPSLSSKGLIAPVRVAHGTFRRPIDDGRAETIKERSDTPSTGTGECLPPVKSETLSSVGSFPPIRVPHGVYMRPIDVPNYRNLMKKNSVLTLKSTDFGNPEIRVESVDEELEELWQDIETYSGVVQKPENISGGTMRRSAEIGGKRRVVGGVFIKPADVEDASNGDSKSMVCGWGRGIESETGNVVSQSCEVPRLSSDSQFKPTDHVVAYDNRGVPSRSEMRSRSCDSDFKAGDERLSGQTLKRPSGGTISYCSSCKIVVHGERTEQDAYRHKNNEVVVEPPYYASTQEKLSTKSSDSGLQIINHRSPERTLERPSNNEVACYHGESSDHCGKMLGHELHVRRCDIGMKCKQCGMLKTSPSVERSPRSSEAEPGERDPRDAGLSWRAVDDNVSDRIDKSSVYGGKRSEESESNHANLTEVMVESQPRDVSKVSTELGMVRCSSDGFQARNQSDVGDEIKRRRVSSASALDYLSHEVRIVSTRIHMGHRSSDTEIKARNLGSAMGSSVRTFGISDSSKALVVCTNKTNGETEVSDAKTCENAVDLGSHEVSRTSGQVRKRSQSCDLEFQAKKQRSDDGGGALIRQEETAMDPQKASGASKVSNLKPSGTLADTQALVVSGTSPLRGKPKLTWWDRVKHRRCRRTRVTFATNRNKEEMPIAIGERKTRTCHSSTDENPAECSGAELVGKNLPPLRKVICDQLVIRDNESLKHETKHQICHSRSSSESLPLLDLYKWTGRSQDCNEIASRNRVTETLIRFRALCRELSGEGVRRVDCEAANIIKRNPDLVIPGKHIGHIPGVEVGDEFCYRLELSIVGLHKPPQAGIDFLRHGTFEICTSIVASGCGGYTNGTNDTDCLIYSGHGGNGIGGRKEPVDQKLQRGNLALKNSISIKNPVRVIRGNKEVGDGGKVMLTYIYDGLYQVESFWQEKAAYGKMVFKFKLGRVPGQPKLSKNQWAKLGRY